MVQGKGGAVPLCPSFFGSREEAPFFTDNYFILIARNPVWMVDADIRRLSWMVYQDTIVDQYNSYEKD
jgi:hypothetical protein